MESGRFAGFFRNAPFDKPGILRVFRGFTPPFSMTPLIPRGKGDFGDYPGVERQGLMDGMRDREFASPAS